MENKQERSVELVEAYILSCQRRGLSRATIRWYGAFLRTFALKYPELPMAPEPIEEFIAGFLSSQERRCGAFRTLRAFYRFQEDREAIVTNPMRKLKMPRMLPKEKAALTLEELRQLLEYPGHKPRVRALLYLLADTGIRIGEVVNLKQEDLHGNTIKITGKTGERIIPISARVRAYLLEIKPEIGTGRLFPAASHWWGETVSKAFMAAGIQGTAHLLRHTFCTLFRGSDQSLMQITGHKSFAITQQYTHRKLEKATEEHIRYGPLARLYGAPIPEQSTPHGEIDIIVKLALELGEARQRIKQLETELLLGQVKGGVEA